MVAGSGPNLAGQFTAVSCPGPPREAQLVGRNSRRRNRVGLRVGKSMNTACGEVGGIHRTRIPGQAGALDPLHSTGVAPDPATGEFTQKAAGGADPDRAPCAAPEEVNRSSAPTSCITVLATSEVEGRRWHSASGRRSRSRGGPPAEPPGSRSIAVFGPKQALISLMSSRQRKPSRAGPQQVHPRAGGLSISSDPAAGFELPGRRHAFAQQGAAELERVSSRPPIFLFGE